MTKTLGKYKWLQENKVWVCLYQVIQRRERVSANKEQNANLVAPKSLFMQFPGNESQNDHKLFLSWYAHLFAMRLYCFFHQNLFPLMCTGFVTSFFSMECGRNHIMQLPKLDHKGACMFGFCSLEMLPWDHYSWRTLGCTEGHQASKDREV